MPAPEVRAVPGPDGPPWGPGKTVAARRGLARRGWGRRRGFGCVFGLVFLLVAGSLVAATGFVLSHFGGLAALIVLLVVVAVLVGRRPRVPVIGRNAG